ncbi:hypothetical protein BH11PSE11_BH11PSE11_32500 [soil metagenome]
MPSATRSQNASTPPAKNLLRRFLLIVAGVFAAIVLLFAAGVLINLGDARITPQTQAFMVTPKYVADPERNAYFVLRAMDAELGLDALKVGRQLEEKYQALYEENPNRTDYEMQISYEKAEKSSWKNGRCKPAPANCVEADLQDRKQLESNLAQNVLALRRYELIQSLPEFEEHAIPSIAAPLLKYEPLVQGSEMLLAKAAFEIADGRLKAGVDLLVKNDEFLRRLLLKTSTLLSRNVALGMMRKQIRTISELVETYPALTAQYGEVLTYLARPLRQEEQSFAGAFASEARFATNYLKNIDAAQAIALSASGGREPGFFAHWFGKLAGMFYQANASLNMAGAAWQSMIDEANRPASEFADVRARVLEKNRSIAENAYLPYLHYVSNPVGKMALKMAVVPEIYLDNMERSADVDGYLRLVGLQVDLRRKKIADAAIAEYASKAGAQFRSPYDGKAMTWFAEKKQLQFMGRQNAGGNPDGENVFVVHLR